jgi:hypothetical protein
MCRMRMLWIEEITLDQMYRYTLSTWAFVTITTSGSPNVANER